MIKQYMLTQEGLEERESELEYLKSVRRREVAEKIKIAMTFGDLSENSEYDEAKNEQAKIEARIADLELMLKNVKIIDESELSTNIVHVGSKVKVKDKNYNEICNYKIVGSSEADPINGKISDESPVGNALIGHKVGDKIKVETPQGLAEYEILEISK